MQNGVQIEELLGRVSACMMDMHNQGGFEEKYPVDLIDMTCWEWPQGVGLYGQYKHYKQSGSKETLAFLEAWFDRHISQGIGEKNINTTAPMLTLAHLYEDLPKPAYLALIEEWCDWMMAPEGGLIRTGDGCFQHMITGDANPDEILIDTLFMAVLFLAKAGRLLQRPAYVAQANYQVLCHLRYLYNKKAGLLYHGWNFKRQDNYGKVFWGRGNGWYTVGLLELLEIEKGMDPALADYFLNIYRHQVDALLRCQDKETALWHTVLDDPDSYIETSASAAFLCGILKGIRLGVLERDRYEQQALRGVESLLSYICPDGTVDGVSYGTPVGEDAQFYKDIPCCPITYGQALMILLLQELRQSVE